MANYNPRKEFLQPITTTERAKELRTFRTALQVEKLDTKKHYYKKDLI